MGNWIKAAGALLVLAMALPVGAQAKQFDNWEVGVFDDKSGLYAATTNDSEGVFAQFCYVENDGCLWILSNGTTCEEGIAVPILVNAKSGSTTLDLKCMMIDGDAVFVFTDFDTIDDLAKAGGVIGFAFPLESGQFKVTRFDLTGAPASVAFMRAAAVRASKASLKSTKDKLL